MTKEKTPLKWKFETGDSVFSSPAVSDDVVYFGSYDNHLYALDTKTGEEQWKFKTGDSVFSSPSVSDGVVYFGSTDDHLYALDAKTGEEKWKFKTGDDVWSSQAVVDGVVYFGSNDDHLYAVDAKTGEEKWKFETGYWVTGSPVVSEGIVYFGSDDKHLYALDVKTGEEKWKFKTEDNVRSFLAVLEGVVYFGSFDNHLYALDAKTGEEKWKFKTGGGVISSPAVVDGVVYFGSGDNHLYSADSKTGEKKWKFKTGDCVSSSPTVVDGVVYFGSDDNHLYAVDSKTGEEKWKFKTGDNVFSSPAVSDDVVYFGSNDNYLYAVDIEAASALGKQEINRQEEEKKALAEKQEEADKHGITVEDIRTKYISGDITFEEAIELQTQNQKRKEEATKLKKKAYKKMEQEISSTNQKGKWEDWVVKLGTLLLLRDKSCLPEVKSIITKKKKDLMRILNNSDCPKIISKLGRKIDFRLLVKVETTIKNTIVTYELREDSNGQYLETCYYRSGYVEVLMEEDDFNNFDWENDKNEDISVYSMGDKIDWDYKDGNINQNYDFNSSDYEDSEEIFSGALKTTIISNLQISDKSLENLIKS